MDFPAKPQQEKEQRIYLQSGAMLRLAAIRVQRGNCVKLRVKGKKSPYCNPGDMVSDISLNLFYHTNGTLLLNCFQMSKCPDEIPKETIFCQNLLSPSAWLGPENSHIPQVCPGRKKIQATTTKSLELVKKIYCFFQLAFLPIY